MATGLVQYTNENIGHSVDEVKVGYLNLRRRMDALIAIRAGNDYQAIANAVGATIAGDQTATAGQTLFDNLDAAMAGMTTAYNALSNMDKNAL